LFDRGAVAYWTGGRDALGTSVVDGVSKIAQCVFDVHAGRVRIVKMEGRSPRLQGATAVLEQVDGELAVGREHAGGRVAEGLRRLRRARNLSQTQIAAMAGVTPGAISQAESGRRGLSLDTVLHLCDALGIGVDDLLASGVRADPQLARHDRGPSDRRTTALFDDPSLGPLTHLVRLGADESGTPPFRHKGTELVLVADGLVLVDLGDTTPVLRAGDALMAGRVPVNRWTNLHDGTSTLFWIAAGPQAGATTDPEPDDGVS
jgi:transcriptional regulator with XRE-family HTH domain